MLGGASKCWGVQNMLGGAQMKLGGAHFPVSVRIQLDRIFHPMGCSLKYLSHSSFLI